MKHSTFMKRLPALILVLWTLVGVPSLCVTGFLMHPCACPETSCGHEELCADDPCAQPVTADARDVRAPIVPMMIVVPDETFLRPVSVTTGLAFTPPDDSAFETPSAAPVPLLI